MSYSEGRFAAPGERAQGATGNGQTGKRMKRFLPEGFLWGFAVVLLLLSLALMLCLAVGVQGACRWIVDPVWTVVKSVGRVFGG